MSCVLVLVSPVWCLPSLTWQLPVCVHDSVFIEYGLQLVHDNIYRCCPYSMYTHSVIYIASLMSSINDSIVSVSANSLQPHKLYFQSDLGRQSASSWAGHISSFLFESRRRRYQVVNWLQKHHEVGPKCVVMVWSSGNGQNADCYSWQYWFSRCQKPCGPW